LHADHPGAHEREEDEREEGWQSDDGLEHSGWQPADEADDEILFDADQTSPDLIRGGAPTASAVAEPLAKTSRTRPSTSTIPNGTRGICVQPTYRRSAQPTLARSRGAALPIAVAVLLSIGALSGWGFWLFSGPAGPPQARYLPRDCGQLVSVKWSDVPAATAGAASSELPGLKLVDRCRIFLRNAGLGDEDVERVSAGQAVDGSGTVIVYQLTRAVRAAVVMDLPPFRTRRKKAEPSEMLGDIPLYTIGPTVIAFPEPQVILNGETDLVRQILRRWSHQLTQPLREYLQTADLTATSVVISAGAPAPTWLEEFQVPGRLTDRVRGTTTSVRLGDQTSLTKTLHLAAGASGDELAAALQAALGSRAKASQTPEPLRQALGEAQVTAAPEQVRLECTLPSAQLQGKSLELLNRLFN
jgi:hypothetical protein